tara:strand:+ start:440 stop:940 length:501 start_codon:yes stop_codon:yes gene_type:complete
MTHQQPIQIVKDEELFKCMACNEVKGASQFYFLKKVYKKTGLPIRLSYCKECQLTKSKAHNSMNKKTIENNRRINAYGISTEDYEVIYKKQNGTCKICKDKRERLTKNGQVFSLSIDHDHNTGRVRGILCNKCNLGLGNFGDKVTYLLRAICYLLKHRLITLVRRE